MTIGRRQLMLAGVATLIAPRLLPAASSTLHTAYVNARVWTGAGKQGARDATAIGIVGARIAAMDDAAVRSRIGKRTRVVDLQGAFVVPGFIDNHTHFLLAATALASPDLRQAKSRAEFTQILANAARQLPQGAWIRGGNWDEELWGGELPTRQWIDAVTPNTPVAVTRFDQHIWLVNSVALRLAGIDRNTPEPAGGRIVRDANGEPTGVIADTAKAFVERVIPPPTEAELEQMLRVGIAHGLARGVTQSHVMGLDWVTHDALRRLRAKGETGMRFYSFTPLADWRKLADLVRRDGRGDDWVRWGALKGLVDGSLGARTALFHEPYDDARESRGLFVTPEKDLREFVGQADRSGLHVAVHAIGDAANDLILDIFADVAKANGARDRRFRVEHAQHLSPAAIPRFARQHVIPSVQPYHAIDDGRWAVNRIGAKRLEGTYAFRSLLDSGARVSFGSDWPVAPFSPLAGIEAAVLRQTIDGRNPDGWLPGERVTVEQALTAYTRTNAYAGFQDDRLGVLAPGYLADFVVLDGELTSIAPERIAEVAVLRTVVDGRERFAA